uniref:C-type lectin domain-containing protein n=1 Tax=Mastacembelus armatus TaxID=205130 RepID=A0A3Q3MH92_9TELE
IKMRLADNVSLLMCQNTVIQSKFKQERKMVLLQTSYNNLTKEMDQLQTSYNNLTEEMDQLQTSYNNLIGERNQLQTTHYSHQGWVYFNGSFYYVSTIKKTWQKSRDNCLLQNADLMIINSKEEMAFVRQFQKVTWIGLTDSDVEAVWKWVDGTLLTLSFWYSGEPNNYYGRNEDCVETNYYDSEDSWNDVNCENENFWVCEKKMAL